LDSSKYLTTSITTSTELSYLSGVTSNIQTQLDSKLSSSTLMSNYLSLSGGTLTGNLTLSGTDTTNGVLSNRYYISTRGDNQDDLDADNKYGPWYGLGMSGISGFTNKPCLAGWAGCALRSGLGYLVLTDAGKVGINTTTPVSRLEVIDSDAFPITHTRSSSQNNYGVGSYYSLISTGNFRAYYARALGGSDGTIATTAQSQANGYYCIDVASSGVFKSDTDASTSILYLTKDTGSINGNLRTTGEFQIKGNNVINLGYEQTKEANAGKIGYGTFDPDALCIVGGGTANLERKVRFWDKVGIGVLPSYVLDVSGDVRFAGSLGLDTGTSAPRQKLDVNGSIVTTWGGGSDRWIGMQYEAGDAYYTGLVLQGNNRFTRIVSKSGDNSGGVSIDTGSSATSRIFVSSAGRIDMSMPGPTTFSGLLGPDDAGGRCQLVMSSRYTDLVLASSQNNDAHGSTLTFATYNPSNSADYRKWVINQGNWGARLSFLDFGYAANVTNPHSAVMGSNYVMSLDGVNRRLGICTTTPSYSLDVNGNGRFNGSISIGNGTNTYEAGCIYSDVNWGMIFRGAVTPNIAHHRWDSANGTELMRISNYGVLNVFGGGGTYAVPNSVTTTPGCLVIGSTSYNYGGWNSSLLLECADYTEIAVHDSGTRVSSLSYYDGPANRIYIGRDCGWGSIAVSIPNTLSVWGDVIAFANASDIRLKTNIKPISSSLNIIKSLNPVTFTWKDDIYNEENRNKDDVGFIAQEVEQIIPLATGEFDIKDQIYKRIKHERIMPYMVKSVQELSNLIEELKSENRELKTQVQKLLEWAILQGYK
jgi:hypothetical protein